MTVSCPLLPGWISLDFCPPLIARSCASFPVFLMSNVILPALRLVDASVILNSVSVTATVVACGFGVVVEVVLATVVVAWVAVGCEVVSATRLLSFFLSAPKTSTAVSIPKKKTNATTMNAGSAPPGYWGRKRGNRNDEKRANAMKAAPVTASPTSCPVERASGTRRS